MNKSVSILLKHSETVLEQIESEYTRDLSAQKISDTLRVTVKGLLENLRSVLDYLAHDIYDKYCGSSTGKKIYFPIVASDRATFEHNMTRWFPGLKTNEPDLWNYLESIQPYNGAEKVWLVQLNEINNSNKHQTLVEQTRTTTEEVRVESDGGRVSWNPSGVTFGSGVQILGVPVDPSTQMPVPSPTQKVTRTTWVDFQFDGSGISALALLKMATKGATNVADELGKWL